VRGGNQRGGGKKDKENHRGNKWNKQAAGKSKCKEDENNRDQKSSFA
jgi:hypothetical protein